MRFFATMLLLLWPGAALPAGTPAYTIETVAGAETASGDGMRAVLAELGAVQGIAADRQGNVYFSDCDNHRVRKVDAHGILITVAGTGSAGFSGDNGPGAAAQLNLPYGLAFDRSGNLYIADLGNNRVRKLSPDGTISTGAGSGVKGSLGDGGPAQSAQLASPRNVAVDGAGNLYISEFEGHRIRKVTADGRIATVAGTGLAGYGGDGGLATDAQLSFPAGLAVDYAGTVYVADSQNQRVRQIAASGVIMTVLGSDPGTALSTPTAVAVDGAMTLYVVDGNPAVRAYSSAHRWFTVAGTAVAGVQGDGGPAWAAQLEAPHDVTVNPAGDLLIADGLRVRKVAPTQVITTIAGDGYLHAVGDGGPALQAVLFQPSSVALDFSANLYIADRGTQRVRVVASDGSIATFAGNGAAGYDQDQIPAAAAALNAPWGIALDLAGNLFIADTGNSRIREVDVTRRIATYATGGLAAPRGVCVDRNGAVYIVDTLNHRVLRTARGGAASAVAGTGVPGDSGDGGPAQLAQLNQPGACAVDSRGNLFIADTLNHRVRVVSPAGVIQTAAGSGAAGFSGDDSEAPAAALNAPRGIAVDDNGDIFIADSGNQRIRLVTPDGTIHTIAGQAAAGFDGDGGDGRLARLNAPGGMVLDGAGDLYFADTGNNRVRRLVPRTVFEQAAATGLVIVNAASSMPGAVAPGEVVTIYGSSLGPLTGVSADLSADGTAPTMLAGVQVRFNGVSAPVFYAQAGQINTQVPYGLDGSGPAVVEVYYQEQFVATAIATVAPAAPALYSAATNQDGGINSQSNPAPRGTVVTFYATGEGLTDGPNIAGQPAAPPYPRPLLPVSLAIGGAAVELPYVGAAPGCCGLLRIDAVVPADGVASGAVDVQLSIGAAHAPLISLWVQ